MSSHLEPRGVVAMVALGGLVLLELVMLLRARRSRYPALLYACAGYMAMVHAVWIVGLLTSQYFESGFAPLELLTFPWCMMANFNMSMAGFAATPDLLLNYARFVLGFGGIQCLLITLFVWELRLAPRRR